MERRMLLAVVLSIVAIVGWMMVQSAMRGDPPKKDGASPDGTTSVGPKDGGMETTPAPGPVPAPGPGPGPGPAPVPGPPSPEEPRIEDLPEEHPFSVREGLESGEWLEAGFTDRGGALRYVTLRHAYEHPPEEGRERRPLDVILPVDPRLLSGMLRLADEDLTTRVWTRDVEAEARTPALDVVFRIDAANGVRITKRWVLPTEEDRFDCDLELSATRATGFKAQEVVTAHLLGVAGVVPEPLSDPMFAVKPHLVASVPGRTDGVRTEDWRLESIDPPRDRFLGYVGVESHYFLAVLWGEGKESSARVQRVWADGGDLKERKKRNPRLARPLKDFVEQERKRTLAGDEGAALETRIDYATQNFYRVWAELELPVSDAAKPAAPSVLHLFVGPKSRHALNEDRVAPLSDILTYPAAPDFLAKILLWILDLWRSITTSVGLAVILMTLTVRGMLAPLSIKNQLSLRAHGRRIARIKPKIDALKKRYANDRRKFQEEQIKLYREHGIGFPMGCLMMLFQIPIFFALFGGLRVEYDLRNQPFLWIHDLSGPDRLIDFGTTINLFVVQISSLNLLPLAMVALSIWQQRLMPPPTDPQQAQQMKMMKWLPIVFAVILYNYTAALALYMVVSSVWSIVESKWVRHHDAIAVAREA